MIEIREQQGPNNKGQEPHYQLYIDGTYIPEAQGRIYVSSNNRHMLSITDSNLKTKVRKLSFAALPSNIDSFDFFSDYDFQDFEQIVEIARYGDGEKWTIAFNFRFDTDTWKHPWSTSDFRREVVRVLTDDPIPGAKYRDSSGVLPRFSLTFRVNDSLTTIESEQKKWVGQVHDLIQSTYNALINKARSEALVTHFDFPEETRVACEQYLLYFVQFLKDLGVDASAELQSEQGRVLFAVTPTNGKEALDKIRDALTIYLNLPSQAGLQTAGITSTEMEVQRLLANIQHLNGQLYLAQAIIQAKDSTIAARDVAIQQLMQGQVFTQSLQEDSNDPQDKEDILGGIVSIKPYEGPGFDLNLPEMFRHMRRWFKGQD